MILLIIAWLVTCMVSGYQSGICKHSQEFENKFFTYILLILKKEEISQTVKATQKERCVQNIHHLENSKETYFMTVEDLVFISITRNRHQTVSCEIFQQ